MNNTERVDQGWDEHQRNENLAMGEQAGMHADSYFEIKEADVSRAMRHDDQEVAQVQEVGYMYADGLDSFEAVENP